MANGPYTKDGRLADVLALIQVLALDHAAHRAEGEIATGGIEKELQGPPRSAKTWYELATEHPEFFRIDPERTHGLSLAARHVLSVKNQPTPTLQTEIILALMETAITLHDRQVGRAQYLRPLLPSLIGLISGVLVALLTAWITHPSVTPRFVTVQGTAGVLLDSTKGQYCWAGLGTKPVLTPPLADCTQVK